jgi:hypothetical protein
MSFHASCVYSRNSPLSADKLCCALFLLSILCSPVRAASRTPIAVQIDWQKTITVSKTTPTLMYMVHPVSRKGRPMHDKALVALKNLGSEHPRFLNWDVYPRLSIAELSPPRDGKTFWDFSLIDAEFIPFLEATKDHEPMVSFAGVPAWMFKNDKPIPYPDDPDQVSLDVHGKELVDPSGEQVAQYFARIVSWYARGGFTDETGQYHRSGYHYELPWWEVLNEADNFSPEQYAKISDAIMSAVRQVSPKTKFIALSLEAGSPETFEYALSPANHLGDTALDMMAYHFYSKPASSLIKFDPLARSAIQDWQFTFFDQVDGFISRVKYIEAIRKRLSPTTRVALNELGTYAPGDFDFVAEDTHIPSAYWNLSAGVFAYLYSELAKQGIDVVSQSLLAAGPKMAPGNTMMNWITGKPNARYYVLKLLIDNFACGDLIVSTTAGDEPYLNNDVAAQAFRSMAGKKLLLINKRSYPVQLILGGEDLIIDMDVVDEKTAEDPPRMDRINGKRVSLGPFAVAVARLR